MKRTQGMMGLLGLAASLTLLPLQASAADAPKPAPKTEEGCVVTDLQIGNPEVKINMEKLAEPLAAAPYINEDEVTLVPARFVSEALQGKVEWDEATQTATVLHGSDKIELTIGRDTALVNGKPQKLTTAAVLHNEKTMVPLRFISEALHAAVEWQEAEQRIIVRSRGCYKPPGLSAEEQKKLTDEQKIEQAVRDDNRFQEEKNIDGMIGLLWNPPEEEIKMIQENYKINTNRITVENVKVKIDSEGKAEALVDRILESINADQFPHFIQAKFTTTFNYHLIKNGEGEWKIGIVDLVRNEQIPLTPDDTNELTALEQSIVVFLDKQHEYQNQGDAEGFRSTIDPGNPAYNTDWAKSFADNKGKLRVKLNNLKLLDSTVSTAIIEETTDYQRIDENNPESALFTDRMVSRTHLVKTASGEWKMAGGERISSETIKNSENAVPNGPVPAN